MAPDEFTGAMAMFSPEVWLPLGIYETVINEVVAGGKRNLSDRNNHCLFLEGRLKPVLTAARVDPMVALRDE